MRIASSAANAAMVVSAPTRIPPAVSAWMPAGTAVGAMSRMGPRETPLRRRSERSVPAARYSGMRLAACDMRASLQERQQAVGTDRDFLRTHADRVADRV